MESLTVGERAPDASSLFIVLADAQNQPSVLTDAFQSNRL